MSAPTTPARNEPRRRPLALITGGSRGLGRALAGFLAAADYDVLITGRDHDALEAAAAELCDLGRVRAIPGDITDPGHRRSLETAVGERLELAVLNASALGPSPLPRLAEAPLAALRAVLETNVIAQLALAQGLVPALERAGGLLVAVTSDAARGAYPGWGLYGASKAAFELLARTLAAEHEGVAVASVDPGDMRTDMHQRAFPGEDIRDRPAPEVTLPFFAWLLQQPRAAVSGRRFEAQGDAWLLAPETSG